MTESVHSESWYSVAACAPRLKTHVRLRRRVYDGQPCYVLCDNHSGRYFLLDAAAYRIIGRFDGVRTLQEIWEALVAEQPANAPTQGELLEVLASAGRGSLIDLGTAIDTHQQFRNSDQDQQRRRLANLNPLSWRLTLADPSGWLNRLAPRVRMFFTPAALAVCCLLTVVGGILAAVHFDQLRAQFTSQWTSPRLLLLMWFAYPALKLVHELTHAAAVHVFGGQVRSIGVTFMAFVPVPFVDASAASGFHSRAQRIAVSAGGIVAELVCAALALMLWNSVEPGIIRDLALVVAVLGGVSTVAVNANPLLRFDGYHVLCDLLNLPNLASRSGEHWATAAKRRVLRVQPAGMRAIGSWQAAWYWAYAPLSFGYQFWLTGLILMWAAQLSIYLALACGAIAFGLLLGRPVWRALGYLARSAELDGRRTRAWQIASGCTAVLLAGIVIIPVPFSTLAQGVVSVPENSAVRAAEDGFLQPALVADGDRVQSGNRLLTLENLDLEAQLAGAEARWADSQASYWSALANNAAQARRFAAESDRDQAEVKELRERVGHLQLHTEAAGRFVMPKQADRIGGFVGRGELLGYLLTGKNVTNVSVAIPQERAALVRERLRAVTVRSVQPGARVMSARLYSEVPQAGHQLPSAALGSLGGGPFDVDLSDSRGLRSRAPVVTYEFTVPSWPRERLGDRVWVRIDHGYEPLATQWLLALRQLFLKYSSAAGSARGAS